MLQMYRCMLAASLTISLFTFCSSQALGQQKKRTAKPERPKIIRDADLPYPPSLPNDQVVVADRSPDFLAPPDSLRDTISISKVAPTIDLMFYPEQNYPGKPWSNWGDGTVADGKYYSAIGDHYAIGRGESEFGTGTAFVYEYDPQIRRLRTLIDVTKFLDLPRDHYTPGKIHSRIDMGSDGWLYYATHRGSPSAATDANHYLGDWIFRTNPKTGKSEVVSRGLVPKHSIPNSVLDAQRMIFYGATAAGPDSPIQEIQFFAFDVNQRKLLYSGTDGPARYMMLAQSTGCLYYVPGNSDGELMRYDPKTNQAPQRTGQTIGVRAATTETSQGVIYTVSAGQRTGDAALWQFNTQTEQGEQIGTAAIGTEAYVASLDVDPQGRYLYYVPGAHGGGYRDGSPLVQFDVQSRTKKVIAFMHPFYQNKYGLTLKGTYSTAVSAEGDRVYITWNASRGTRAWDCCALTVVHIPDSER